MARDPRRLLLRFCRRLRPSLPLMLWTVTLTTVMLLATFYPAMRDTLLPTWARGVPTWDLMRMHLGHAPPNITAEFPDCKYSKSDRIGNYPPKTGWAQPRARRQAVGGSRGVGGFDDVLVHERQLRREVHGQFMPVLSHQEKERLIQLYKVASAALTAERVPFFLVAGGLLGVLRHRGLIPWDDDLDLAINVNQWEAVSRALGCLPFYRLAESTKTHWKFFFEIDQGLHEPPPSEAKHPRSVTPQNGGRVGFPFIDIFFYVEDDLYIWAATPYLLGSILFLKKDIFPLGEGPFEDLVVPVPRRTDVVLLRGFGNWSLCSSPSIYHRLHEPRAVYTVPCSELLYIYPMVNLM